MGKIFLLDGPSGSGKSTIVSALLARPELKLTFAPRLTTRSPRPGDGADYRFVSQEEFDRLEVEGQFASFRRFQFGMCYGLPRRPLEEAAHHGNVLALTDLGTVHQLKAVWPECIVILLVSPLEELKARLSRRKSHTAAQIEERLCNARKALELVPYYDYVVPNRQGHLSTTLNRLAWILQGSA